MIYRRLFTLWLSVVFLVANAPGNTFDGAQYTALPAFQIDLERGRMHVIERGHSRVYPVEDCSNDTVFCIRSLCSAYATPSGPDPDCRAGDKLALIWPRKCVFHYEVGSQIEHLGITARLMGYYNRKVHHTGMRGREAVWMTGSQDNIGLLVRRNQARGILLDSAQSALLPQRFAEQSVIDQTEIGRGDLSDIIATTILPSSMSGQCSD